MGYIAFYCKMELGKIITCSVESCGFDINQFTNLVEDEIDERAGGQSGVGAFAGFGGQNEVNYGNGYQGYTSSLGYGAGASVFTQVTTTSLHQFGNEKKQGGVCP